MLVDFAGLEIDPKGAKSADRMGIRYRRHRNLARRRMARDASMKPPLQQLGFEGFQMLRVERHILGIAAGRIVQFPAQFRHSVIKPGSEVHTLVSQILDGSRLARGTTRIFFGRCPVRNRQGQLTPFFSLTWHLHCRRLVNWASRPKLHRY